MEEDRGGERADEVRLNGETRKQRRQRMRDRRKRRKRRGIQKDRL